MSVYNFDEVIDRNHTGSRKWDSREAVFGTQDVLPMWIADMDFAVAPAITKAIQERTKHPLYGYNARDEELYQSVSQWVKRRQGWDAQAEWVINAPGVVTSIAVALLALTNPGDQIVIQPPVYPPFFSTVTNNGREIVENPLRYENGRYEMDFEDLEKKLNPKVKMLLLCSPHNPTGRVWTRAELERLADICLRHNVIVLSDEIHSDLIFKGHQHIPFASISAAVAKNTLTCISASKTFNIPGLYTSFVIISDREIRKKFAGRLEALSINQGNTFGITAAKAAYRGGEEWLEELLVYLEGNARFIEQYVEKNIAGVKVISAEGTYLGWLDFQELFPQASVLKKFLIEQAKVGFNDGLSFGSQGEGFARINFGCSRTTLQEALQRIEQAVKALKR